MRLDSGTQVNNAGVRLRCWAAPPSITEEDVEDECEEDAVSLRAISGQGTLTSFLNFLMKSAILCLIEILCIFVTRCRFNKVPQNRRL